MADPTAEQPEGPFTYVVGITLRCGGELVLEGSLPFRSDVHPAEASFTTEPFLGSLAQLLGRMARHQAEWNQVALDAQARHDGAW